MTPESRARRVKIEKDENQQRVEFSKKLTSFFLVFFAIHMVAMLASAMFELGDCRTIKESFQGSLPFYAVIFTGYTAKAAFENFDKFKNQYNLAAKEIDADVETERYRSLG